MSLLLMRFVAILRLHKRRNDVPLVGLQYACSQVLSWGIESSYPPAAREDAYPA